MGPLGLLNVMKYNNLYNENNLSIKICLALLLALCVSKAFADEKDQLLVPNFESKILTPLENERVRSLILRVGSKQEFYHLVLHKGSRLKSQKKAHTIKLNFSRSSKGYGLEGYLYDAVSGRKLKKVSKYDFGKEHIYPVSELALEVLFNLKPIAKLKEYNAKPPAREKFENEAQPTDAKMLAFRQRILDFKEGVAATYKEIEDKKQAQTPDELEGQSESGNKKKKKKSDINSQGVVAIETKEGPKKTSDIQKKQKWLKSTLFRAGLESQNFDVVDKILGTGEVQISTNIQYLNLGGELSYRPDSFRWLSAYFQGQLLYPVRSDDQVDAASAVDFSLGTSVDIEKIYTSVDLSLDKTTALFGALPSTGEGLKLSIFNIYWLGLKVRANVLPKLNLYAKVGSFLTAEGATESSVAKEFSASHSTIGATYETNSFIKDSLVDVSFSSLKFSNSATTITEGEAFNFRSSLVFLF